MRGRGAFAAAVAALLLIPATATAAPPPGAAISDNLDYVARVAGAAGITEGKFDKVRGKKVLVVTGRFGFKTYDVSNPEAPALLDEFLPAGIAPPGRSTTSPLGGYWQDEDMELDTRRKLIIGALDPRHDADAPVRRGVPARRHPRRPRRRLQERLLRDLVRRPGEHATGRRLREPAVGPHGELHPEVQVHLDRWPRAAR